MAVTINAGQPTKLIITIPSKGDTNWNKIMRQAFQDIGDHDHSGVNGRGAKISATGLADGAIEPRHLSNDINLSALSDVQLVYDPNDPTNPSLDGKLLVWDSTASKWVPTDPSSAEIGGGSGGGSSTLDDVNTVGTFNNGDNIGTTIQLTDQDAFVTTGGVADFTAYVGGNPPISPSLTDVTIYADVPVKMEDATNVTIFTDSPVELTGDATDVQIVSDSTVTIAGNVSGGNISSGTLDVTGTISDANVNVQGVVTADGGIDGSSVTSTGTVNTEGSINASDIRTESSVITNNNNIVDSTIIAENHIDAGTGTISYSNVRAKNNITAARVQHTDLWCSQLLLDYSKYDPTTSTPYTSQSLPIYGEILCCDLFVRSNIRVINDELNWNDDNIRGDWTESRIFSNTAVLDFHGYSRISNVDLKTARVNINTSSSGANSEIGFRDSTRIKIRELNLYDNSYGLDFDTHIEIARNTLTSIGFNNTTAPFIMSTAQPYVIKSKTVQRKAISKSFFSHSPLISPSNNVTQIVNRTNARGEIYTNDHLRIGYHNGNDNFHNGPVDLSKTLSNNTWHNMLNTPLGANLFTDSSGLNNESHKFVNPEVKNSPVTFNTSTYKFEVNKTGRYELKFSLGTFMSSKANNGTGTNNGAWVRLYHNSLVVAGSGGSTSGDFYAAGDYSYYSGNIMYDVTVANWGSPGTGDARINLSYPRVFLQEGDTIHFEVYFDQGGANLLRRGYDLGYFYFNLLTEESIDSFYSTIDSETDF